MPYKTQHSIGGKGRGYSCPRVLHAEDKTDSWMHHLTAPGNSELLWTNSKYHFLHFGTISGQRKVFCGNKSYEEN